MRELSSQERPLVGIDTGGTFTDFVFFTPQGISIDKLPSCPEDPARPIRERIVDMSPAPRRIVHGTTVATNALLQGAFSPCALITTKGFEDVIEIGRQNRPDLYALHPEKPPALIPIDLRFGITERMDHRGNALCAADSSEILTVLHKIRGLGIENLAVCLLHSYANPVHEKLVARIAETLGFTVTCSWEILREFREFERCATTVVNAGLRPIMESYLRCLEADLPECPPLIMQSSGGCISAASARRRPIHTALSGPAGGVAASAGVCAKLGITRFISFDMGGTSTDVSLYDGAPGFTTQKIVGGIPLKVAMLDIHTVGAGGGSIAYRDTGGALKVGPISAGADPGPICYGKGTALTVTDAHVFLGRIPPHCRLAERVPLHAERIRTPMEEAARGFGLSAPELAEGIIMVANAVMQRALRVISVEKGHDPSDFALVSFGGAGGLHAVELAQSLGIKTVIVPRYVGVFSALGMVGAEITRDKARTVFTPWDAAGIAALRAACEEMTADATRELRHHGAEGNLRAAWFADMRYQGQSHELTVDLGDDALEAFHRGHEKMFGYAMRGAPVQATAARVRLSAPKPDMDETGIDASAQPFDALPSGTTPVMLGGAHLSAQLHARDHLLPGAVMRGPAVITETTGTTFLPPRARAEVDNFGNLVIRVPSDGRGQKE